MNLPVTIKPEPDAVAAQAASLARRLAVVLVVLPTVVVLAVAARLLLQMRADAWTNVDQELASFAFLSVAAAGPIVIYLLWRRLSKPLENAQPRRQSIWSSPLTACIVLSVLVSVAAVGLYRASSVAVTQAVSHRLQAVATLKEALVKTWIDDALDDLQLSIGSPDFSVALNDWQANGAHDSGAGQRLVEDMLRMSRAFHYVHIGLHDGSNGKLLLTTASGDQDTPSTRRAAVAAAAASAASFESFHIDTARAADATRYLGAFAAVRQPPGARSLVVHVEIDPRHGLFPLLEQWPGTSSSGEVWLLQREPDAMLILNREREGAEDLRSQMLSTTRASSIGTQLVRRGSGAVTGDDERGESVLAYAVDISGTDWLLMAKQSRAEAYAELKHITLLGAAIVGAIWLLGAWWWVEHHRHLALDARHRGELADQNRRLSELSRRLVSVQEQERRRWSSELHDRTGVNLAAVILNLKVLGKSIPSRSDEDHELLRESSDLLADTVVSIRDLCSTLRPTIVDYAGLVPALQASVDQLHRRTGAQVSFDHARFSGRCNAELETVLFRIAQEALMNAAKHANATRVDVTLAGSAQHLRLCIADNGDGFDPQALAERESGVGQGLLNMRERAAFCGAGFALDASPGQGTRVTILFG